MLAAQAGADGRRGRGPPRRRRPALPVPRPSSRPRQDSRRRRQRDRPARRPRFLGELTWISGQTSSCARSRPSRCALWPSSATRSVPPAHQGFTLLGPDPPVAHPAPEGPSATARHGVEIVGDRGGRRRAGSSTSRGASAYRTARGSRNRAGAGGAPAAPTSSSQLGRSGAADERRALAQPRDRPRLERREQVDLLMVGGGPAGLAAAVYGASEGLDALVVESFRLASSPDASRRIETTSVSRAASAAPAGRPAVTQARNFHTRTASPYQAEGLVADDGSLSRRPRGRLPDLGARRS